MQVLRWRIPLEDQEEIDELERIDEGVDREIRGSEGRIPNKKIAVVYQRRNGN